MIAAYVSGHGFGHATRTGEVLRVVREVQPELPLTVISSAPRPLFARAVGERFTYREVECDPGLVQRGALSIDEEATVARVLAFSEGYGQRVNEEAMWLSDSGVRVVLGDVPPLAFDAAAEVGLPAVGLANFSWDWIYHHLAVRHPALQTAAEQSARAYNRADLLLALPFAGDLSAFPWRERIPLVARCPRVPAQEVRHRLGWPGERTVVLLSFGGFGLAQEPSALDGADDFDLVRSQEVDGRLESLGLGYPDLVGAADVVVSKPGYGIVSDVIGARRRLVYTDRGDFPEYPILVREMVDYVPAAYISHADLMAGRIGPAVREVMARPMPAEPDISGAAVAARRLLQLF